jgi:hypothetical protein
MDQEEQFKLIAKILGPFILLLQPPEAIYMVYIGIKEYHEGKIPTKAELGIVTLFVIGGAWIGIRLCQYGWGWFQKKDKNLF